jgi:heat shock protein 90kDa beta
LDPFFAVDQCLTSLTVPIWLFTNEEEEVPVDEEESPGTPETKSEDPFKDSQGEEVLDEDDTELEDDTEMGDQETIPSKPKTVKVAVDKWVQLNVQAPIWMR